MLQVLHNLTLETGSSDAVVDYSSGSGSNALTFNYTIGAGENASDLDYESTSSLALNSGTIKDAALNAATLTLASPGATNSLRANKDLIVDTTVPADFTVGSVITTGGTVTAGKWNSTNTGINVTVPLADDATLIGGTLQIQASVASGSYENLGGAHTIADGEENTNVTSSFSASTFEALSGGISDGESILFKAILTDKAGNAKLGTQSGTSIAFDQSVPAFSSVTPSTGSSVKVADVGYTLSEAIASGTVKYTQTGGSSDSGSPHTQNLSGAELNTGARSLAALSSAPTLVDGATYTIDFNGVDAAGNAATQVSVTGIFFDTTVPADFTVGSVITTGGTVTAGKWNSTNTGINVTVPLADDATLIGGTLQIQASVASGSYENLGGAHTIADGEENTNVTSSFSASTFEALSGGISDGESILFKAILTDKAGNAKLGTQSGTSIAFDQSVPAFSSVTPSTGSSVKVADVGYTLSEAIASGTVKYTQTGGSSDSGSPHTQNLSGAELNTGARSLAALSSAPTLVDGATYTIDFNGVDAAGNAATQVSVTGIFFDTTVPTVMDVTSTTANGSYKQGDVIAITVGFNEVVNVTGTPQLTLETGSSDAVVDYSSGSGSNTLTFNYTIGAGENASDLDYTVTSSLALNSGTIKDAALNAATLTLASPGATNSLGANKALIIDTTVPTVMDVTSTTANGSYKQGDVIPITVGFSEVVNVTGTLQLTLETGSSDAVVNYSSGTGTNTLTFNYTVGSDHTTSDLDYVATSSLALPEPNPGTPVYEDTSGDAEAITVSGNYAYVADGTSGLAIIDISDPTSPGTPVYKATSYKAKSVAVSGNYAYVIDQFSGLAIIDISDPTNPGSPSYTATNANSGTALAVAVSGNYAYVAASYAGLVIINISDPTSPGTPNYYDTNGMAFGVTVSGNYAYVADRATGLAIFDISNPASPGTPIYVDTNGEARGVAISGNYAYVADKDAGLAIIDISDPTSPGTSSICRY